MPGESAAAVARPATVVTRTVHNRRAVRGDVGFVMALQQALPGGGVPEVGEPVEAVAVERVEARLCDVDVGQAAGPGGTATPVVGGAAEQHGGAGATVLAVPGEVRHARLA